MLYTERQRVRGKTSIWRSTGRKFKFSPRLQLLADALDAMRVRRRGGNLAGDGITSQFSHHFVIPLISL